jgi:hypothetical protein
LPSKIKAQTAEPQTEVIVESTNRLEMLETFAGLISERWGYVFGRKINTAEANKAVKADAAKAREIGATFKEHLANLRKVPTPENAKALDATEEELKKARKIVAVARKPFTEKSKPLVQAIKYLDNVAVPDSLKEIGYPILPRFSLSEWVGKAVDASKKKD